MRTKTVILTLSTLSVVGLSGCGGSSGSGQAAPTVISASGSGMLGPVSGATVVAVDGVSGYSLEGAIATTASDGSYSLQLQALPPSGVLELQMSGGTYVEEADLSKTPRALDGTLHAIVPSVTGGTISAAITPLTEIAYQQYVAQHGKSSTAAQAANAQIEGIFGVSDIIGVTPAVPSATASLPNNASGTYESVLIGISIAAEENAGGPVSSTLMAAAYAQSLTTSGVTTGSAVSVYDPATSQSTSVTPPSTLSIDSSSTWVNVGSSSTITLATSTGYGGGSGGTSATFPTLTAGAPAFWLKADSLTGNSNGASLSAWNDSSSSGYTCSLHSLSGSDVAPTYVASGQGGMPAVSFGGTSDKNEEFDCNDNASNTSPFTMTSNGSLTVMFVANGSQTVASNQPMGGVVYNSAFYAALYNINGSPYGADVGGWLQTSNGSPTTIEEAFGATVAGGTQTGSLEFTMGSSGGSLSAWQNGYDDSSQGYGALQALYNTYVGLSNTGNTGLGTIQTPTSGSGLQIGGGFAGQVQEIVIFTSALSNSDRSAVECYFSAKYSLNLSSCQ